MADIIDLGPHERMNAEEVLSTAAREPWESVIVCGFHRDGDDLVMRSSNMSRETALWIAEHLKLHILGRL
jgi:hypothetical protein